MSFLGLTGKTFLVLGVANKKSVAWHVAQTLEAEGAKVVVSDIGAPAANLAADRIGADRSQQALLIKAGGKVSLIRHNLAP